LTRDGLNWNIRKMKNKGIIKRVGPDKGGHWEIVNNDKKITVMQFNQP
jgi:ATP-dependent DNA helicase RecG